MHNHHDLTLKLLCAPLTDRSLAVVHHQLDVADYHEPGLGALTLKLKPLGFDPFETNLLTIPAYVLFLIQLVFPS
ncbi:hypothetical protein BDW66DRAFT_124494 [Aspergillus desertorum]